MKLFKHRDATAEPTQYGSNLRDVTEFNLRDVTERTPEKQASAGQRGGWSSSAGGRPRRSGIIRRRVYSGDAGSGGAANSRGSLRRTRGRHLGWIADSAAIRLTAMMPRSALVEADGKREKEQNSRATVHRQWR